MSYESDWQRLKRQFAQPFLNNFRAQFLRTKNPIFAFEAYRFVRAADLEIPEWFFEILDQWGEVLCLDCPTDKRKIADALGLGKGGSRSIRRLANKAKRDQEIWTNIQVHMDLKDTSRQILARIVADPDSPDCQFWSGHRKKLEENTRMTLEKAFVEVGDSFDLKPETIRDIWYQRDSKHRGS